LRPDSERNGLQKFGTITLIVVRTLRDRWRSLSGYQ